MSELNKVSDYSSLEPKVRSVAQKDTLDILADIYRDEINMAVWSRQLPRVLSDSARQVLDEKPGLCLSAIVNLENAHEVIWSALGKEERFLPLAEDMFELVSMFFSLFDLGSVGIRLSSLEKAMCPRFHVDHVPCRLISTYHGDSTEWISHEDLGRLKRGRGDWNLADAQSNLFSSESGVRQLREGEVALLKGEGWVGNEGAGLVHRSPKLTSSVRRLLMTLDFSR